MKVSFGIKSKVSLIATILVLLSFSILGFFVYFNTQKTVMQLEWESEEKKLTQLDSLIFVYINEKKRLVSMLAQETLQSNFDVGQMIQNLRLIQKSGDFNLA